MNRQKAFITILGLSLMVIAAQDGWLVVYSDTTFSLASMIGWVPVHKGVNTNLKVNINSEVVAFGTQALPAAAVMPKAQAPAAAASALAGVPQTSPAAGASLPPIAWFVLAVLGGMALAAGVILSRMQVRK